jgi:hypothetical protein
MKKKIIMGIFLGIIMIISITLLFLYKDTMFENRVELKYADGCIEKYINAELVTPICELGRRLESENENTTYMQVIDNKMKNFNLTIK